MELWKEKRELLNQADLIQNISGAETVNTVCDYLFYTNFSELEAEAFFDVFKAFNRYYTTQSTEKDIRQLSANLEKQIKATSVPPLEMLLYTSRTINKYIENNERVFNCLASLLQSHIKDNYKSIECMANAWEWKMQLLLLAEACGYARDDKAIEIMMNNYHRICKLFGQSDKVQKAFIRMLIHTQDEKNIKYMADIVASPQFYNNPACHNLLKRPIRTNESFISQYENEFLNELFSRNIPSNFKVKVERTFEVIQQVSAESFVWEWGSKTRASLNKLSHINNKEELPRIVNMIIDQYPQIKGKENQQKALHTIATKAYESEDFEVIEKAFNLCNMALRDDDDLSIGAYLGLFELKKDNVQEAYAALFEMCHYHPGAVVLGNYFRFRRQLLNDSFIPFIEDRFIACDWNKDAVERYVERLKVVIEKFDLYKTEFKNPKIFKFNSRFIDLFEGIFSKQAYDGNTYNNGLDMLLLIADESNQHKDAVVSLMEKVRNSDYDIPNHIRKRIDGIIKRLQPPTSPQ